MSTYRQPDSCAVCPVETVEPLIFKDYCRIDTQTPPKGKGWFCRKHADQALALEGVTLAEAIKILRKTKGKVL